MTMQSFAPIAYVAKSTARLPALETAALIVSILFLLAITALVVSIIYPGQMATTGLSY
jgi:hypothetical protein